ncbi:GM12996 [Drosophila sechellia]|uniref:GM12996 n=1 Tax=Drosophila sechellia TaxID=7238 RepID=B4ING7_DROSE|nr:GM12996 [Drosophila sechellia]
MAPPVQKGKLRNHSDKTSTEVNCAINENVRKLVRSLSEPGTSQKKLRQMEDTALKIIANQRRSWDPTTTDMEVKRNLDDLAERFRAEGMASLGDTIKDLAIRYLAMDENQQQFDPNRGWSMLELLFCIADRPVQKIRRNRELMEQLRLSIINSMEAAEREPHLQEQAKLEATRNTSETDEDWPALLAEDFLDPPEDDSSDSLSVSI